MKGYKAIINDNKVILGGISNGNTGVIITIKEGQGSVFFSSMNEAGMISYTWYEGNLSIGDKVRISYEDIEEELIPNSIVDFNDKEFINKLELDTYYKLKEELTKNKYIK